jgi:phage gp36-like protein
MNDYSTPYLALHKLIKQFHETIVKGEYAKAHEISIDIADVAQALEDISKELRDAYTD